MEKGFNADVVFKGLNFHVQTEDWGSANPYIVSRVYQGGAIIKSVKTAYADVLSLGRPSYRSSYYSSPNAGPKVDPQAVRLAMREQHEKILDLLLSGQLF